MLAAVVLILACPLAGAALLALCARVLPRRLGELLACLSVAGSLAGAVWAWAALRSSAAPTMSLPLVEWFSAAGFSASFTVFFDPLAAIMATMVGFVALVIHVHSVFFMRRDAGWARYFCYLNLFVFFMQVIVLAGDLVFLFLGWEGVGFCSFALIGFWYAEPERVAAGRKAFVVTRIGDVAFIAAIAILFGAVGTLDLAAVTSGVAKLAPETVTLLGLLFLWAAVGKSAQLPLLVWLPDAMAGPTPVSALIHAATMVTAGVYLLMRLYPLLALSAATMAAVALVGALTALLASCAALTRRDIKRVLAWSTISQVGYMFLGLGAGDPTGGFFHLLVHAFFKSLLFMSAGIVIQALGEEHDIFRMGARTRKAAPGAAWAFLCGAVALAGLPPFAGYFSKGRILEHVLARSQAGSVDLWVILWLLGFVAALFTAIYSFRVFLLAFTGRADLPARADDQPWPRAMLHVLWPLALLALCAGALNLPGDMGAWTGLPARLLDHALAGTPGLTQAASDVASARALQPLTIQAMDAGLALAGLLVALFLYGPQRSRRPTPEDHPARTAVLALGTTLDRVYLWTVARPYALAAEILWRRVDDGGADALARSAGRSALALGRWTARLNTGRLSTYLVLVLFGLAAIILMLAAVSVR